jgi:hypothetical protein
MSSFARISRWKRWLMASLALATLVLAWRFALVPLGSSGPGGSSTGSSSRASSPVTEKHRGPVSSLDGAPPELAPEGAGSLEPALLVEGRVVDEEGRPVPRATVRLPAMEPRVLVVRHEDYREARASLASAALARAGRRR